MNRRTAFTMVELLVVMAIIAVLAALIFAGVQAVRGREQGSTTATEIQEMGIALEKFKTKYGVYPPSKITLTATEAALDSNTKKILFRLWPNLDYASVAATLGFTPTSSAIPLKGDQCLVLFLGGRQMATVDGGGYCKGFSTRPSNPFEEPPLKPDGTFDNDVDHDPPFYNFKTNRLTTAYGNKFLSYRDPFSVASTQPLASYAYFSSTLGYNDSDCKPTVTVAGPPEQYADEGTKDAGDPNWVDPISKKADPLLPQCARPYQDAAGKYVNPTTYQIIAPGRNRLWGKARIYSAGSTSVLDYWNNDNYANFANGIVSSN